MRVIRNLNNICMSRNTVVAIGVFDGVHRAHRMIINAAVRRSRRIGAYSVIITFWPHPRGQKTIYSLDHRLRILSHLGVDICIVVPFNGSFSRISPEAFVEKILCGTLKARDVYVGENFHFGRNARGDAFVLSRLCLKANIRVRVFKTIKVNGKPISSSHIRRLISCGNLALAAKLLCAPVSVYGHVVKGTGKGREMGFPTANIDPHHEVTPPQGVYAVRVLFNKTKAKGVCSIGRRPTFSPGAKKPVIEVHVFGLKKNIYGMYLEAQFIAKLRKQRRFPCRTALIRQIKRDIAKAKKILSRAP